MANAWMGKTFVVTGATSGIGLAVAEALVRGGASLIGVARSPERCAQAVERLESLQPAGRVAYLPADLSLQSEVRALARGVGEQLAAWGVGALDGLANVAGVFAYWQTLTAEGYDLQWAVNHLAPFLLTRDLLPLLCAAPSARVVTVSSASHRHTRLRWDDIQLRRRYNPLLAYKQTKMANVLFTAELARRLGPHSTVRALAADPGLVRTEIGLKASPPLARLIWSWRVSRGVPPATAAAGIVTLLTDPALQTASAIYWKDGRPRPPDPYALDANAARRLWELSEAMCGLPPLPAEGAEG